MPLLLKNKKYLDRIEMLQTVFICLFAATLCLQREINQAFIILGSFVSLFLLDKNLVRKNKGAVIIASSIYLVAIISTFYSSNKREAFLVLERQMTFLILPVILGFSFRATSQKMRMIISTFVISVFFVCVYLLITFYGEYKSIGSSVPLQEFLNERLHHHFSEPLNMHATYLSMYVCFALACSVYMLFFEVRYYNLVNLIFIPAFLISLILLSSRIVFIPLILILIFIFPFFISRKAAIIYMVPLFIFFLLSFNYVSSFTAFKERFKTDTLRELNMTQDADKALSFKELPTNDATRAERWKCALELIKEKPLLGYGTGDEKSRLNEKYIKYNLSNSVLNNFDAHNQYLAYMIKSGLAGIVAYLLVLIYGLVVSFKTRNYHYLCFLLIIMISSLTENIMESNKGILFFAIFNSLLVLTNGQQMKPGQVNNEIKT